MGGRRPWSRGGGVAGFGALCFVAVVTVRAASALSSPIPVNPTAGDPLSAQGEAVVDEEGTFRVRARSSLALTPPPGVQQTAARAGWTARLGRQVPHRFGPDPGRLDYPCDVLRIRPASKDEYWFTIRVPAWVPPGLYIWELDGPGLEGDARGRVRLGRHRALAERVVAFDAVAGGFEGACPPGNGPLLFELLIGPQVPAVRLVVRGQVLRPISVWPASTPAAKSLGARLLVFKLNDVRVAEAENPRLRLDLRVTKPPPCTGALSWVGDRGAVPALRWLDISYRDSSRSLAGIYYAFGEEGSRTGTTVRHRFLLQGRAHVDAFAYDDQGGRCVASASAPVERAFSAGGGCGCRVGSSRGFEGLWAALARMFF